MSTLTLRSVKGSPLTNTEVDNNFSNLNADKYESGDSPSFVDLSVTNSHTAAAETISAAGTIQGDATSIGKTFSVITSGTANQGVILPTAALGLLHTVVNATSVNIKVYPASGETLNSGTLNAAIDLPAGASMKLVAASATDFKTIVDVVIYNEAGTRLN